MKGDVLKSFSFSKTYLPKLPGSVQNPATLPLTDFLPQSGPTEASAQAPRRGGFYYYMYNEVAFQALGKLDPV